MLANGAKFYYAEGEKPSGASGWTEIPDLKEIPEMGADSERVENTGLNDMNKQYEMGIGDLGETTYTFKHPTSTAAYATSALCLGRKWQQSHETVWFREVLKDGAETIFSGQASSKRTGAGVNGVLDTQLNIAINSDLYFTDPT